MGIMSDGKQTCVADDAPLDSDIPNSSEIFSAS